MDFYSHAPRGARLLKKLSNVSLPHFYSHAPRGARLNSIGCGCRRTTFLLTRPSRGATFLLLRVLLMEKFLLTRPSRGATIPPRNVGGALLFLLTRPSRGATISEETVGLWKLFLLTRPSRGATFLVTIRRICPSISTHTPLAGRDCRWKLWEGIKTIISTHTPLAGRDTSYL